MFEFLKSEKFSLFFSFVLGFAIICIFQPICMGKECEIHRAPSIDELKSSTYRIGTKCYQFRTSIQDCPPKGAIEAFEVKRDTAVK